MNPFALIALFDEVFYGIYETLFVWLRGASLELFSIGFTLYLVFHSVKVILGQAKGIGDYIFDLFVLAFFVYAVTNMDFLNRVVLNIFVEAPFSMSAELTGGQGGADAFESFFIRMKESIDDAWSSTTWRQFGLLILIAGVGYASAFALGIATVYVVIMAKMGIAILIAIMPLFLVFAAFSQTRNLAVSYMRQLINFSLIPLLIAVLFFISGSMFTKHLGALPTGDVSLSTVFQLGFFNFVLFGFIRTIPLIATGIAGGMMLGFNTLGPIVAGSALALSKMGGGMYSQLPNGVRNALGSVSQRASQANRNILFRNAVKNRSTKQASSSPATPSSAQIQATNTLNN